MADLINEQLIDDVGNNVFPKVKMYLHKIGIAKSFSFNIYFNITTSSPIGYDKDSIKPIIITPTSATGGVYISGEPTHIITDFYLGSDDDDNDLVIEYEGTDTIFTYTSNEISVTDTVVPL